MKRLTALTVLFSLCWASLSAQDEYPIPTPPDELKKFDRLIGTWAGSGTATMAPGTEAMPWTSKSSVKKAMNGFFLEEITVIDIGPMMPAPLVFRSFFGFDSQNQKYMQCAASSMGAVAATEIHWQDDHTMVTVESGVEEGNVVVDRWVTNLGTDGYSFVGHRAIGGGEFFVHIRGEMKRSEEPFEAPSNADTPGVVPVSPEMSKLNRMAGHYRLEGKFRMMPDASMMDIGAEEHMERIFGGTILQATVKGDPMPGMGTYEAWAAFAWDARKKSYVSVYVNNMGEIAEGEARWVGDHFVSTSKMLRMGQPSVSRGTVYVDENGKISRTTSHSIVADHEPMMDFEGTYTLLQN